MKLKSLLTLFLSLLLINTAYAKNPTLMQTKNQLKQLENKMSQLQDHISRTHDKQGVLAKELSNTEKQLQANDIQLKKIRLVMQKKQQEIAALEKQVNTLSEQLVNQQKLLAKHIRARYKMGEYQPLQWLLNQDKPSAINRLLTFHQYVVQSRQHVMDDVVKIKKTLILNQNKLHQELAEQTDLQQQLNKRQQIYDRDKLYRKALIGSLAKDIKDKQQALLTYQHNRDNLSRLLTTLAQKSVVQTRRPFTRMRKKLQQPVKVNSGGIKKINQGVVFFSDEGTPVVSVSPGKVVFGDWLNGYGLLLIIDHGKGFMTLYANNSSIIKHKGDIVNQGEKIALVGHSGTLKQNGLYFEIRQRGKAINPLEWMS